MKSRINDLITVFLIQLVLTLPFYTANVYGLTISNVRVAKVSSNSATIEWSTDNISNGRVRYGQTTALGFTQRHDNFIGNHTVALFNGIDSDTAYFFAVESTDLAGNNAIDNNSNNFYTFKTTDINPPPQVTGLRAVSATSNSIFLSWNNVNIADLNHYAIYRNRVPVATSTTNSFNDTSLQANTDFSYKVSAVDNSGNEGAQSDTLIASTSAVDSTAPVISNVDALPITDTTARITWLTNENSTTTVLYGINKTDKVKSSNALETNHSIIIDSLTKNLRYTFIARSCDASNNCADSPNQSFIAGKDITAPFINLEIPRFVNRRIMDITGSTEPFSSVTLFVNDMNIPKRSLSSNEVGGSGKFVFAQVQLQQDNIIRIVVVDRSGNRHQRIFEVSIDTEDPIVQLNEVPSLTSKTDLAIAGFVNEPVAIKVFVDAGATEAIPSKITGLNAAKIGQNSVEFHWNESKDKDFSHYVVYRADASPIATTKPANFNLFIDALVDSGRSYTYQVSAVNVFGKEGPKSEPITVTTLRGGFILNLQVPEVDIFEDFRKPLLILNASGSFNFSIKLNKGDTIYKIKLIFEDRAENSVIIEKSVTLDTKKPEVKIISPPSGAFIFENVANEVDVTGTTEPNARVHLFVDRTPFSYDYIFGVSGLPNEVQNTPQARFDFELRELPEKLKNSSLKESDLDAKCRSSVSASFCRTGADFSVDADEQGNFKFEKVDLTAIFGGAGRIREVPVTEFRDTQLNPEGQESKRITLVVIATDKAGQRGVATQAIRLGTCWSGNQSWDIIPLTRYQSPTFLSTERFAEGTETIYFYFNYSYIGRGQTAKIADISLSKACGTREVLDPRFNISCQILPSGGSPVKLNKPDNTLSYSAITLSRFPGMDRFLEDDWKSFFKAINNELTFPFKVRITYEHDIINENGQSVRVKETQTTCEQVSYVVDNSIIDPRKVLPDWLLFDFVDFLQESIVTLTQLQEQIDILINYVGVGCLGSILANTVVKIWRNWAEFTDEKLFKVKGALNIEFKLDTEDKNRYCKDIAAAVEKGYGSLKLKYFSDADLERCFPSSASVWKTEANIYKLQRWSCDRIFGHSSPSGWTETVSDDELHRTMTSAKTCGSDASVQGQKFRAENCKDIEGKYRANIFNFEKQPIDKKCFQIQSNPKSPLEYYIYTLDDQQDTALTSNKIYKLTRYETRPSAEVLYAIKINDNLYMTKQQKTCAELCGLPNEANKKSKITVDGKIYEYSKEESKSKIDPIKLVEKQQSNVPTRISACVTANECREWHVKSDSKAGGIIIPGRNEVLKDYEVKSKGYTSDCFYEEGDKPEIVSDTNSNLREECCCVNGKVGPFKDVYYQPEDIDPRLPVEFQKPVHKSKSKPLEPPQKTDEDTIDYSDMEWSYRYSKIGYLGKKYNPNRYITGRDASACLGQDNLFYKAVGKEKEILIVDPAKQDTATLIPCVYLTGVNQRLQRIKLIASAMSTCLIKVRTTGRADAGACKEVFTQHLCDAIWQGIRFFIDGCTPDYLGPGDPNRETRFLEGLKGTLKGISQGISEAQKEISDEYSNAKLNDLLGTGEESIARKACLFAFGYDWEFNVRNLIDAAYSAPFATLVQAVTRSREFLTVDPQSLKPKYEYRASWIINPGCDLERYDIKLACVSRKELDKYPNQINCGSVGAPSVAYTGQFPGTGPSQGYSNCDCLELPQEELESGSFFSESRIKQNSLVDKNNHKVIESNRRYDHLKFLLRTDRKIAPNARSNCFPTGYEDGVFYFPINDKSARDIADCTVDLTLGLINCGSGVAFFSRKGTAQLIDVTINGENANKVKELSIGDRLEIGARVTKTGQDKCLRVSISPDPIQPVFTGITLNGTHDIAPIRITDELRVAGRRGDVIARGISYSLRAQNNRDIVTVSVKAFDGDNKDRIYGKGDRVIVDGEEIVLGNDGEYGTNTKIRVADKTITVQKEDAIIEIKDVTYTQTQAGSYELQEIITINPPQQVPQTSQQKTILVELFHLKEDRDSYNNADDCSLNEKIGEAKYTLTISQTKGTDASKLGPVIQNPTINPRSPITIGQKIIISSRITHSEGISEAKVSITWQDGQGLFTEPQSMSRDGNNFEFIFETDNREKGKYRGNINAVSRTDTKSNKAFEFDLR